MAKQLAIVRAGSFPDHHRCPHHQASASTRPNPDGAMDLTPVFNQVLAAHDSRPVEPHVFRIQDLDEFLKEAYRIVGHVARIRLQN